MQEGNEQHTTEQKEQNVNANKDQAQNSQDIESKEEDGKDGDKLVDDLGEEAFHKDTVHALELFLSTVCHPPRNGCCSSHEFQAFRSEPLKPDDGTLDASRGCLEQTVEDGKVLLKLLRRKEHGAPNNAWVMP